MGQARHSSLRSVSVESGPYSVICPFSVRVGTGGCGRATTRHVPQPVKGPERSASPAQIVEGSNLLRDQASLRDSFRPAT